MRPTAIFVTPHVKGCYEPEMTFDCLQRCLFNRVRMPLPARRTSLFPRIAPSRGLPHLDENVRRPLCVRAAGGRASVWSICKGVLRPPVAALPTLGSRHAILVLARPLRYPSTTVRGTGSYPDSGGPLMTCTLHAHFGRKGTVRVVCLVRRRPSGRPLDRDKATLKLGDHRGREGP